MWAMAALPGPAWADGGRRGVALPSDCRPAVDRSGAAAGPRGARAGHPPRRRLQPRHHPAGGPDPRPTLRLLGALGGRYSIPHVPRELCDIMEFGPESNHTDTLACLITRCWVSLAQARQPSAALPKWQLKTLVSWESPNPPSLSQGHCRACRCSGGMLSTHFVSMQTSVLPQHVLPV